MKSRLEGSSSYGFYKPQLDKQREVQIPAPPLSKAGPLTSVPQSYRLENGCAVTPASTGMFYTGRARGAGQHFGLFLSPLSSVRCPFLGDPRSDTQGPGERKQPVWRSTPLGDVSSATRACLRGPDPTERAFSGAKAKSDHSGNQSLSGVRAGLWVGGDGARARRRAEDSGTG